mgnify:CR=1 FL=1
MGAAWAVRQAAMTGNKREIPGLRAAPCWAEQGLCKYRGDPRCWVAWGGHPYPIAAACRCSRCCGGRHIGGCAIKTGGVVTIERACAGNWLNSTSVSLLSRGRLWVTREGRTVVGVRKLAGAAMGYHPF